MQNNEQGITQQDQVESRRQKQDAGSGNDGSSNQILEKEKLIDPGNEHHHPVNTNEKSPDQSSSHDADSGSDGTGTTGVEPGEGENDEPDTSGEKG